MKKICIFCCGGNVTMVENNKTKEIGVDDGGNILFKISPRVKEIAKITLKFITNVDGTNINTNHWEKIVDNIDKYYDKFDGFIITTGVNTISYTAAALSFAIQNLGKPIVITGAQLPVSIIGSDARTNILNSIRVASSELAGVMVVFGSKIIKGCRVKKQDETVGAFVSMRDDYIGEVGKIIEYGKDIGKRHKEPVLIENGFDKNIISITLSPDLKPEYLNMLIDYGVKAILLRGYGNGEIHKNLFPFLDYAKEKRVPVVVTTQCPGAATRLRDSETGLKMLKKGVVEVLDMVTDCAFAKMMWLLSQKISYEKFKYDFRRNMVGEITYKEAEELTPSDHDKDIYSF